DRSQRAWSADHPEQCQHLPSYCEACTRERLRQQEVHSQNNRLAKPDGKNGPKPRADSPVTDPWLIKLKTPHRLDEKLCRKKRGCEEDSRCHPESLRQSIVTVCELADQEGAETEAEAIPAEVCEIEASHLRSPARLFRRIAQQGELCDGGQRSGYAHQS